jgi:hypothetical protein
MIVLGLACGSVWILGGHVVPMQALVSISAGSRVDGNAETILPALMKLQEKVKL